MDIKELENYYLCDNKHCGRKDSCKRFVEHYLDIKNIRKHDKFILLFKDQKCENFGEKE